MSIVYCSQMAGWIKMALGMEVALDPGHIVLDGDLPPLPKKGTESPIQGISFCQICNTLVQRTFQKSKCVSQNLNVRPKLEARRAESRVRVLGEEAASSLFTS